MSALYRRQVKQACRHGHEYTEANTVWIKSSRTFNGITRNCLTCQKAKLERRKARPEFHEQEAEKMRRWRLANPELNRARWREQQEKKKQILLDARAGGCIRCGEQDPACLDFHHRNGKDDKLGDIGTFRKFGKARLLAEIAKCDVLCANCHRKFHRDERQEER